MNLAQKRCVDAVPERQDIGEQESKVQVDARELEYWTVVDAAQG